jgi:hypothetical protein
MDEPFDLNKKRPGPWDKQLDSEMKIIKLTTFNDLGDCDRQDVNDLISALVRMGYEVWMDDNFVCFNFGNDDVIKDEGGNK